MFADLLIHELDVHRRTGQVDRFGQAVDQNPSQAGPLTGTVPCRLSSPKGGRINDERSTDVFEVTHKIFCLPDADVREDDTVVVRDPVSGYVLLAAAKVRRKSPISDAAGIHHLELEAVTQRGPQ